MSDRRTLAERTARAIAALEARGVHAFVDWSEKELERQLSDATSPGSAGGSLAGETVAIKDNICDLTYRTTCSSRILEGWCSPFEATAVRRLRAAGALVAGKTNCDEFGMGSSTEFSCYGPTLHPLDYARVPGGSSGGSAAAVAAGAVAMALGSETGGSVRQPAAFCGVVGIKPTYGRVSRYGLVAFGSSLDQIGTFGSDVAGAARLLAVISGRDPLDATSLDRDPLPPPGPAPASLAGTVIGIPREYYGEGLHPGVAAAVRRATDRLRGLGAELRDVSLPHTRYAVPTYYVIAPAEASSNLARYDGVRYGRRVAGDEADVRSLYRATRGSGFGPEVRRRILLGTYVLSAGYYDAYYGKAQRARERIRADFARVFGEGVHALFTPTAPTTAFKLGENLADPVAMYLQDIYVCTANLAGVPALSLPIGRDEGLPVGGQLIGPMEGEAAIVRIAQALERVAGATEEVR
ncbi:MAG: Asp-tRNA(Asn)/Glu-tRNA(Gln) amidotransferase subunit GatA [Gemmatimonadales bacterium]